MEIESDVWTIWRPAPLSLRPVLTPRPVVDLRARLVFGNAVAFLNLALQLVALAVDGGQIVIREIAPLLLDFALDLLPVSLDSIPVHWSNSLFGLAGQSPNSPLETRTNDQRSREKRLSYGCGAGRAFWLQPQYAVGAFWVVALEYENRS